MKKSLLAVAAMTAFAGAAQAQSSVTVYGLLDVGYTGGNSRSSTAAEGVTKQNVSRISNSMESGSRIGFRGTEDLGGGKAAVFTFELGIQPAGNGGSNPTGNGTTPATNGYAGQGSAVWNPNVRQAFVGLSSKGLGVARVGTQNTLFWEQAGSNTVGELNQTIGSMLAPTTSGAFYANSTAGTTFTGAAFGAYTERTTNTINIRTERMAGLIAKASYTLSNQDSTQTAAATTGNSGYAGGTSNQSAYQLALDYSIQKANIQASYGSFKSENPYNWTAGQVAGTAAAATAANGASAAWGNGTQGQNMQDTQTLITGSYDFGILKAYAGWTDRKQTSVVNSNLFLKRSAQEIGVRSYITPTIEAWGSVGNGRFSAYGVGQPTANITGYQLGSNYWMSKRTNLYAIYGQNGTSNSTNGAFNVNQYSIGARHTF
jgi:predicted porin